VPELLLPGVREELLAPDGELPGIEFEFAPLLFVFAL
jgi:hypothetical protein